jgi:aminoglycoside phosphotransferase (APT) family kinase protein
VRDRLGIADDAVFPRIRLTATSSAGVIVFLGRSTIIRVPLDPVNEVRVRRNFEGLQRAKALSATLPEFASPSPLLSDTFQGVPYTVESHLEGRGYESLRPEEYDLADRQVFDFLVRFKMRPIPAASSVPAGEVWRRLVVDATRRLAEKLPDERMQVQARQLLALVEMSEGGALPVGFSHGDFWWGNILVGGADGRIGLVDWDGWSSSDFATNDFLHFACYRRVVRNGSAWGRALIDLLEGRNVDSMEAEATERFAAALRLPRQWKIFASVAYWVQQVTGHDDSKLQFDQIWTEKIVNSVLPSLIKSISSSGMKRA